MPKRKRKFAPRKSPERGLTRLGDLLPQLIARYGLQQGRDLRRIEAAWRTVVGAPFDGVSRVAGLKRGTLEIAVPHNAFVQELSFRHAELLKAVQAEIPEEKVRKIKFIVSALSQ